MGYFQLSDGFREFKKLRDARLEGLERRDFQLSPEELLEQGYILQHSEYYEEEGEEHEFHAYSKGPCRAVYLESYIEKEGGMYVQSLFASKGCLEHHQK